MTQPRILWTPDQATVDQSNIEHYRSWLKDRYDLHFSDYTSLWKWSCDQYESFWESIMAYFEVQYDGQYEHVVNGDMPDVSWFDGIRLNYAEHIFRDKDDSTPAILFTNENQGQLEITWGELRQKVGNLAAYLKSCGVTEGDRVAAYLPNIPEATIAFLAANSLGAIWTSSSPDFGSDSVIERFAQIEPKVLIGANGYWYNGKTFGRKEEFAEIRVNLPTVQTVIEVDYLNIGQSNEYISWRSAIEEIPSELTFTRVSFSHPIWVLYSSGTTGLPKAITHSVGGSLIEHLKYVTFHNDVKSGERFFWFTTTGWMMWNYVQATMLAGATIVLYDGSPGYSDMNAMWQMIDDMDIQHFGTSAPFIVASMKKGVTPKDFDLSTLRSISSTGSPLPSEGFDWVYDHVKRNLWLVSMSGGTDVCTAFVGGNPTEPVLEGEIQRPALGCDLASFDEEGIEHLNQVGEMVIKKPMPSMPVFFWGDESGVRYRDSYFDMYEGVWRHGDWLTITDRGSVVIHGRSDATLNRHGVRIGTAEIYSVVDQFEEINDSLIVNLEQENGSHFMPLFVKLKENKQLDESLISRLTKALKNTYTPRHVPDDFVLVSDIPYTLSGKKMEAPVKKILMGRGKNQSAKLGAMRNPDSLDIFVDYYQAYLKDSK